MYDDTDLLVWKITAKNVVAMWQLPLIYVCGKSNFEGPQFFKIRVTTIDSVVRNIAELRTKNADVHL
jgi:hypothetical protein